MVGTAGWCPVSVFVDRGSYYIKFKEPFKGTWKSKVCGAKTKTEAVAVDKEVERFIAMRVACSDGSLSTHLQEPAKTYLYEVLNWISERYFHRSYEDAPKTLGDLLRWWLKQELENPKKGKAVSQLAQKKNKTVIH